tara:strand:+ start:11689 stop:13464 length:1776 start_codon:yes stop_codon:yes gene_type:complete
MSNTTSIAILSFLFIFGCTKKTQESLKSSNPNILIILTDDQGYGDLSMTGNPYLKTPVIDQLAKNGVFADRFYVSPVCAPTRASFLTGRYHQTTGVSGVTRGQEDMGLDEVTMADVFKSLGYKTGIFGKWHNGAHYPYHPLGRGFDEFVGFTSGHWSNYFDTTIEKNGKDFKTQGYLSDVLTTEAINFIEKSHKKNQPFLCYLPYQTPHTPLQVPDVYFDKYKALGVDDYNAAIYGMCENIDDNVGRILKKLEQLRIEENTIVVYFSDNGPNNNRFNSGLKGRKGAVDEGGMKVPFIISWKGTIQKSKIIKTPLAHIDLLPTLLELINKQYKFPNKLDGTSFAPLLSGKDSLPSRILFNEWAGRKRAMKDNFLMVNSELFDVEKDPNQTTNIKESHPKVFENLSRSYKDWYTAVMINSKQEKPIPVGYNAYPKTILPAHEANLYPYFQPRKDRRETGIAYHSLYGWAHDWIDFWITTDAYVTWNIEVIKEGNYTLEMLYALANNNVGVKLSVELANTTKEFVLDAPFEHRVFENHDRVLRTAEAPETDWKIKNIGDFYLPKGVHSIKISSKYIPGEKSIELKELIIKRNEK